MLCPCCVRSFLTWRNLTRNNYWQLKPLKMQVQNVIKDGKGSWEKILQLHHIQLLYLLGRWSKHIVITGPAGTGKTLLTSVIRPLQAKICTDAKGVGILDPMMTMNSVDMQLPLVWDEVTPQQMATSTLGPTLLSMVQNIWSSKIFGGKRQFKPNSVMITSNSENVFDSMVCADVAAIRRRVTTILVNKPLFECPLEVATHQNAIYYM